jgi:hypothetical protein
LLLQKSDGFHADSLGAKRASVQISAAILRLILRLIEPLVAAEDGLRFVSAFPARERLPGNRRGKWR